MKAFKLHTRTIRDGVYIASPFSPASDDLFERVRRKENRDYKDDVLKDLPDISVFHPEYKNWCNRKKSAKKIVDYIVKKKSIGNVLQIGCGNGWLANYIVQRTDVDFYALDIDLKVLKKGASIHDNERLHFVYGDIFGNLGLEAGSIDYILLYDSAQYFPNLTFLVEYLNKFLSSSGEIHIMDTPIYHEAAIDKVKLESRSYYQNIDCAAMSALVHHHSYTDIKAAQVIHPGKTQWLGIMRNQYDSPYLWVKYGKHT